MKEHIEAAGKLDDKVLAKEILTDITRMESASRFIRDDAAKELVKLKNAKSYSSGDVSILNKYRAGLSYLEGCGEFDEAKFRELNSIIGNKYSEADIENQLNNAKLLVNGMADLMQVTRSTLVEAIGVFEDIEQKGVDLSSYKV